MEERARSEGREEVQKVGVVRTVGKESAVSVGDEVVRRSDSGGWAEPEVGEKRVQGDNVVERCRKEGSRANKRDMTVSALRPVRFAPWWCPSEAMNASRGVHRPLAAKVDLP